MQIAHLNAEQRQAVLTIQGPLLIIAGAGSGKTRVITYRMAHMLEEGIPQSHILALTFTNKAASEMDERIHELTKKKLSNLTIATFHGFGLKILKEQCKMLGYRSNFTIYDTEDQMSAIKEVAYELKLTFDYTELVNIQRIFSSIKTERAKWDATNQFYQKLYQEYEEFLLLKNAFDFDDLIVKPLFIFRRYPDVVAEYSKRYEYIMVDEFQDTSEIQYQFLYFLAKSHQNLCVVGDDDQSIYSWRGANFQNISNFERDFPARLEIKLEQNYRSTGSILKAANAIISNNENRKTKELWTKEQHTETAVQLRFFEDDTKETDFICEKIRELKSLQHYTFENFGVLVRTNRLMNHVEDSFTREQIPYTISGGSSFFERREIKDMIAYLRLIDNPDDDISFLRIINVPRRGVGMQTLNMVRNYAHQNKYSIYSAVSALAYANDSPLSHIAKENLLKLLEQFNHFRGLFSSGKDLAMKAKLLCEDINYWLFLQVEYRSTDEKDESKFAKYRYDNVMRFFQYIENWEKRSDTELPQLNTYLNRITLSSRDNEDENANGKVSLMTIHAAKGLEFDVTFIVGVEDGIIPHKLHGSDTSNEVETADTNIEEERRLFYVAVTRARKNLFLTVCEKRKGLNNTRECTPSPFLREIPEELIETQDTEVAPADLERMADNLFSRFKEDDR
ncbi:MAG: ATP-dependent helicase [Spirochaetia bacterium]